MDITRIRSLFPELGERIYLNAASEGPMPAPAVREAQRIAELKARPWEIGTEYYYDEPAAVRARLEQLLGAPAGSVALVAGTSAGIGIAARDLGLGPKDEILLLEGQFPSNVGPWRAAEVRGAKVRTIARPFGSDPTEAVLASIGPATRVVSIDWVNFVDGAVADLAAIGSACRRRGIRFVVDAAQGIGCLSIDVQSLAVDILAAPSHKWLLGPVGAGLLYVTPALIPTLQPWNAGWVNLAARSGFRNLLHIPGDPPADATRFETGSPPYGLLVPWKVSLDLLVGLGARSIEGRVLALAARLAGGISELSPATGGTRGLVLLSPHALPTARSGIVSFLAAGDRTAALYRELLSRKIVVALREGAIRVSPHLYNTEEEIDALLDACRQLLG